MPFKSDLFFHLCSQHKIKNKLKKIQNNKAKNVHYISVCTFFALRIRHSLLLNKITTYQRSEVLHEHRMPFKRYFGCMQAPCKKQFAKNWINLLWYMKQNKDIFTYIFPFGLHSIFLKLVIFIIILHWIGKFETKWKTSLALVIANPLVTAPAPRPPPLNLLTVQE